MTPRLSTRLLVNALMRSAQQAGGVLTVIAHGDDSSGALLLICLEQGQMRSVLERGTSLDGRFLWHRIARQTFESSEKWSDYTTKRFAHDPDLWLIELDIPEAERFADAFALGA